MRLSKQALFSLVIILVGFLVAVRTVPASRTILDAVGMARLLDQYGLLPKQADESEAVPAAAAKTLVTVIANRPQTRRFVDQLTSIGTAHGLNSVVVTAGVEGRITAVAVAAGDMISKGDLIAELESESQVLFVERAKLALRDAQVSFDRAIRLQATGSATDLQVQEAQLALDTRKVELKSAEYDLMQRRITAPASGVLGVLDLPLGQSVTADSQIARIEDRQNLIVDFQVPERFSGRLKVGQAVTVSELAEPQSVFRAEIFALDNKIDEASRSLRVQAVISHPDSNLRAGMALKISAKFEGEDMSAVVPLSVQWSSDGPFVWLVREGKAEKLPIHIVQRTTDAVLIKAELSADDLVVSEGVQMLRPGIPVSVAAGVETKG